MELLIWISRIIIDTNPIVNVSLLWWTAEKWEWANVHEASLIPRLFDGVDNVCWITLGIGLGRVPSSGIIAARAVSIPGAISLRLVFPDAVLEFPFATFGSSTVWRESKCFSLETTRRGARNRFGVPNPLRSSSRRRIVILVESKLHSAWVLCLELEPGSINPATITSSNVSWRIISFNRVGSIWGGSVGLKLEQLKFNEFSCSVGVWRKGVWCIKLLDSSTKFHIFCSNKSSFVAISILWACHIGSRFIEPHNLMATSMLLVEEAMGIGLVSVFHADG